MTKQSRLVGELGRKGAAKFLILLMGLKHDNHSEQYGRRARAEPFESDVSLGNGYSPGFSKTRRSGLSGSSTSWLFGRCRVLVGYGLGPAGKPRGGGLVEARPFIRAL